MQLQYIVPPQHVIPVNGKYRVTCRCGKSHPLGAWGAAHLGNTEITKDCPCGRQLVIPPTTELC